MGNAAKRFKPAFLLPFVIILIVLAPFFSLHAQTPESSARQYLNKGLSFMNKAQFKEANTYLNKARQLFIDSGKPVMAAHCYNHLSSNNRLMSNLEVSQKQAQKALSLLEGMEIDDPTERIRAYTNLGLLAALQAKYDHSTELLKKASELVDNEAVSPVLKMVVISSLGYLYDDLGKYDEALYYYNKALSILTAQPKPPKARLAKLYNNMGVAYTNKGLYRQARHYYKLELKSNLAVRGKNHPNVAGVYLNLGNNYNYSGDVGEALIYFKKARRIISNVYGHRHAMMVIALKSIGNCQTKLGNLEKGITYFKEAIKIKIALVGANHPELASSYSDLASIYLKLNNKEKAYRYYKKALTLRKSSLRDNHPDLAASYSGMAAFYLTYHKPKKALIYLDKASNILYTTLGVRHPKLAKIYTDYGDAYAKLGNIVQSISFFQKALAITAPAFNGIEAKDNPQTNVVVYPTKAIFVLTSKAASMRLLYKNTHDISLLKASIYAYMALSKLLDKQQWGYNQLNSKITIARRSYNIYEQAIEASYKMYEATGNRSYFQLVFYFSEKSKGRVLLEAVAHTNDKKIAGIPEDVLNHEQQLKYAVSQVKKAIYSAGNSRLAKQFSVNELKDSLFTLNRKIAAFTQEIEEKYPKFYRLKYNSEFPELYKIQQQLKKTNTAIVEYFYGTQSLYAIIITPDNIWVKPLNFSDELAKRITNFRKAIITDDDTYYNLARNLYQTLIEPVESYLKLATSLLIIPGRRLRILPFGALLKREIGTEYEIAYPSLPYLIKDYNISYGTSIALNIALSNGDKKDYALQFLGFAPVFASNFERGKIRVNHKNKWQPLSFTDYEIKTIASDFNSEKSFWDILPWVDSKNAKLFLEQDATEANFKNESSLNARYIHLATHAFTDNKLDRQTGIVFYQKADTESDNILYTNEIYNLRMNTQLVVLSACETGLGAIIPGEGIMGLSRAFQYAGANSLIVSLWRVNDRSTAELMIQFYDYLKKNYSITNALSAAKRAMINNQRYANPRYWATFKLIGSTR